MKLKLVYISLFSIWAFSFPLYAQTTNTGMLYVSPDTKFSTLEDLDNTSSGEFYNDGDSYIYADFNNDGVVDFLQNSGLTRFLGSNIQLISGVQEMFFFDVLFDNGSVEVPFQLSGNININGTANFSKGIVDNDNFGGIFSFANDGLPVNVSDISHVDGEVIKYGVSGFMYPIGDGGYYRRAGISEPTGAANYRAKYYLENSNALHPHDSKEGKIALINNAEYWTIEKVANESDVLISLSWDEATTPTEILAQPREEALHIVRWDEGEQLWIDEGGVVNEQEKTITTAVSKYGMFTLARVKTDRMPCELAIYNGVSPDGDGINDYFRIDIPNTTCGDNMEKLHVQIYNRWGVKVYETNNYGTNDNVFKGYSNGRLTVEESEQLPSGTYFYIINFDYVEGTDTPQRFKKAGYLYLSGN